MLRVDDNAGKLMPIHKATLTNENLLERADFQRMIVAGWEAFANELGFPTLQFIGQEIVPHPACKDRIDILAFDDDEGKVVLFELKRGADKLQLLQALSYAAMVAQREPAELITWAGADIDENLRKTLEDLEAISLRVVLVAEAFDPEVILTADWLSQFGVEVLCFALHVHSEGNERFMSLRLHYPLPELDQLYRARGAPRTTARKVERTWDEVKEWISYPEWGTRLIDLCRAEKPGDPGRRRFVSMFSDPEWGSCIITFQKDDVTSVMYGRRPNDVEHWQQALPGVEVGTWGNDTTKTQGLRLKLSSEGDVRNLIAAVGRTWPEANPTADVELAAN